MGMGGGGGGCGSGGMVTKGNGRFVCDFPFEIDSFVYLHFDHHD